MSIVLCFTPVATQGLSGGQLWWTFQDVGSVSVCTVFRFVFYVPQTSTW